jgi:serine protease AprX
MDCKTEIQEFNFNIDIPRHSDKPLTLKITLVWNDPASKYLQNDLDLIVSDSVDTEKHRSMDDDGHGYDRKNNVEQVIWKNVDIGRTYNVAIRAVGFPLDDHPPPFSYAWQLFVN